MIGNKLRNLYKNSSGIKNKYIYDEKQIKFMKYLMRYLVRGNISPIRTIKSSGSINQHIHKNIGATHNVF